MKKAAFAFLIILIPSISRGQAQIRRFISYEGIGDLTLCQDVETTDWKILRDSSSSGRGFEYYGKYLMNANGGVVLSQISVIDSSSIIQLTTSCKEFESYQGIKVGTPVEEIVSKFPECNISVIKSDAPEIFFSLEKASKQIKFNVDSSLNREFENLNLKEEQKVSEVEGLLEAIKKTGQAAVVKEISVLYLGMCNNRESELKRQ